MQDDLITVFTPTYNRAYTLPRLYESLKEQTLKTFEWIIVDDGSTDETMTLVSSWMKEKEVEIIYLKVKNGGKHRAINKGVKLARGKLFFIVDSDDYLTKNALERVIYWESTLKDQTKFAGVAGNRGINESTLIGTTFKGEYIDATSLERQKYGIEGDKAEVFYTQCLREYPFPEIEGETFMDEFVVWFRLAHEGYKLRWFNEITYICEYLQDGLTKNLEKIQQANPKGIQLGRQLYQQFLGAYLAKEKEGLLETIKQELIKGQLKNCKQEISKTLPLLKEDLDVQLIQINLLIFEGQIQEAYNQLKELSLRHSTYPPILLKMAELEELDGHVKSAINYYQKALLYTSESSDQRYLIKYLQDNYQLQTTDLFVYSYQKLKSFKENNQWDEAILFVLSSPHFDEVFKLELMHYENQIYYQKYIILLLLDEVLGYPVLVESYDYVYGHAYFNAGLYSQALESLKKIPENLVSPLTAFRLSMLYDFNQESEQMKEYKTKYQQWSKKEANDS